MKNIIILSLLFLTLGILSCSKFLKEKSQDQLIPTTTTDFLELLNGQAYPGYKITDATQRGLVYMDDDIQMNNIFKTNLSPSINTDGNRNSINAMLPVYSWQPDAYEQIATNGQAGNKDNFNAWGKYYALIMGANNALDNADASVGIQDDKNYLKGQAYGLRAYYYFMLANFYGQPYNATGKTPATSLAVPLVLTATKYDPNSLYKQRNTVQEVYKQITSDLDSAILYLEKRKTVKPYRMNYLASHLLASRVYLYMEDWQKVITHADAVLAIKPGLMNLSAAIPQSASASSNAILGPTNIETLWTFGGVNDYLGLYGSSQTFRLSDNLLSCFSSNDLRAKNTFIVSNVTASQYGYTKQTNKQYNTTATMKAFRVAEAYLNRAEAYLQLGIKSGDAGMTNKGLDDLMTLRVSRYTLPEVWTTATPNLLDSCKSERRKELFLEDHRWFDLRRYGMPAITHVFYNSATDSVKYMLTEKDLEYVWPIPREVIERNDMLVPNEVSGLRPYINF